MTKRRFRLSESEMNYLNKLRGNKENKFKKSSDGEYRPRITKKEAKEINNYRRKVATETTRNQKNVIKRANNNQNVSAKDKIKSVAETLGVTSEEANNIAKKLGMDIVASQFSVAKQKDIKKSKRYLISSAQTASKANNELLANMKAYAAYIGAEIAIIATRYKNPTSLWMDDDNTWDKSVLPYLTAKRQMLGGNIMLLADMKIQATAPNPTNGMELFGGFNSCIVGSPRIEMRSVATLIDNPQKFIYSTGTVTEPSFTDSVAGGKAAEHHSYGFIVVEIESNEVSHVRNVSAHSDGSFTDLWNEVHEGKITRTSVPTLVWGDSHFAQKKQNVTDAFRLLCEDLHVSCCILHDVYDSKSINVHNTNDPIVKHQLMESNDNNLNNEIDNMFRELMWFEDNMDNTYVIGSNHDNMLDRVIKSGDWRDDLPNAIAILKLTLATLENPEKTENGVISFLINEGFHKIHAIGTDNSLRISDIECGMHGHIGANGARGNINGFSKLSTKTITGHSHSPAIRWGAYQVGVSCGLKHGYNKGLSNWAYAGCTIDKTGKRQMIVFNKDTLTYTTMKDVEEKD